MDIIIEEGYISPIITVIKWYLETYEFDAMNETWLNRICSRLEEAKENYIRTGDELYLVKEAFSHAKSEKFQDGVTQSEINNIYTWLEEEYRNSKKQ